ncbi:MAG: lytic murein transglycosylase [Desulfovibrionaceae bacterium]|nr:lytic murein transglycosylase [Desulfovibrionaceae bacterium]
MSPWTGSERTLAERMKRAAIVTSLAAVFVCALAVVGRAEGIWQPLVDRLADDGVERSRVAFFFSSPDLKYSPEIMGRKMNALLNARLSTTGAASPRKPEVMGRYLNPILIAGAYAYYREHRAEFAVIRERYGVPGEILTALLLVESSLGVKVGDYNAFTILASMALSRDFSLVKPHIERRDVSDEDMKWLMQRTEQKAQWGYEELKALIRYAHDNGLDPLAIPSSVYGAIGQCQFIPSSAVHYGRDGSGDGRIDLFETRDVLHSMANFLASHGWKPGLSDEAKHRVLYRYNHSDSYAMTILAVADKIRKTKEFFEG